MLQGLGRPLIPVVNLFIGAVFKFILTYTLTVIPSINVKGAAIGTVAAYATASILNLISLAYLTKMQFNYFNVFVKPLISSLGMAVLARFSYIILYGIVGSKLSTIVSIMIGVVAYVILLIITGTITSEDMLLLPKGQNIARKLDKYNLMK
jgi:stage V sporulation protein B